MNACFTIRTVLYIHHLLPLSMAWVRRGVSLKIVSIPHITDTPYIIHFTPYSKHSGSHIQHACLLQHREGVMSLPLVLPNVTSRWHVIMTVAAVRLIMIGLSI